MHPSRAGALLTIGLHGVVLAGLLSYSPARSVLLSAAPIMVDWIVPAQPVPTPEPRHQPPQRVKAAAKPIEAPPVARAEEQAPAAMTLPEPPPAAPAEPVAVAPPVPAAPPAVAPAPVAVTPPVFNADYLDNPPPAYPALSRRMREQGRVVLRVLVNTRGAADDVQVSNSSGHPRLDDSALEAVRHWKFVPAKRGSAPVAAWVLIPVSFRLEG